MTGPAGSLHWRVETARGALHAWVPPGFDARTAGTVVYVHGYRTTADAAWTDHRLGLQFEASRQNALFVVPESPATSREAVRWESLGALLERVQAASAPAPAGPIVVVAHSGGYRTVAGWLGAHPEVDQVTLLDALYGHVQTFSAWLGAPGSAQRTMNLVSCRVGAPRQNAERLIAGLLRRSRVGVATRRCVPVRYEQFDASERRAQLLHILAHQSHMGLVTGDAVLPVMLRRSPLPLLVTRTR